MHPCFTGAAYRIVPLVYQLTGPVLRPIRRVIPPIAGIDLSPLFALVIMDRMVRVAGLL